MSTTTFNLTQLHLIKMFAYAKTDEALSEMKKALVEYYSKISDKQIDALWDAGVMATEKIEEIKNSHLRTPYIQ